MLALAERPRDQKGTIYVHDVIFEICLRLPPKSLLVCKSVSKQWLSVISDRHFINKHCLRNRRLSIPGLILKKDCCNLRHREYDYICMDGNATSTHVPFRTLNFAGEDIRVLRSCNGLLLCGNFENTAGRMHLNLQYYIYNPFTRQYKVLPLATPYTNCHTRSLSSIELAFDPVKSSYYKVICIWSGDYGRSLTKRIEIYSSETSSWRLCEKTYTLPIVRKSCVLWNGSLNWIANDGGLIYFDIDEETLGEVVSPWEKDSNWYTDNSCLDVYGGHLLFLMVNWDKFSCFDVMEMDTSYTGWILKYRVDMEGLRGLYPELGARCSYKVLFIDEVEEFSPKFIMLIYNSGVVISYDSEKGSCTTIYEWESPNWLHDVFKYVESLACA